MLDRKGTLYFGSTLEYAPMLNFDSNVSLICDVSGRKSISSTCLRRGFSLET